MTSTYVLFQIRLTMAVTLAAAGFGRADTTVLPNEKLELLAKKDLNSR